MKRLAVLGALTSMFVLGFSNQADAYIDPASGTFIIQAVLAGLAATAVFGRSAWRRLRSLVFQSDDGGSEESRS